MPILVICLIAVLVVCVAISAHNKRYGIGQKVTAKVTDSNTGKVIISGRGNSVGSSIVDSFSRVWNSVLYHPARMPSKASSMPCQPC